MNLCSTAVPFINPSGAGTGVSEHLHLNAVVNVMLTYTPSLLSPEKSAQVALESFKIKINDSQARDKSAP